MKAGDIDKRRTLSYAAAARQIAEAKKRGYKNIDFFGGEPTCFSFLKKAARLANDLHLTVTLATNALKFSSPGFARDFFQGTDIAGIRTTLHSYKPRVHDAITRVKGSFDKSVKGIRNILKYNQRLCVNTVINARNYQDIVHMPAYVHNLGVKAIKFSGLIREGRALLHKQLVVENSLILPCLLEALREAKKLGFYYIEVEKLPREIFQGQKPEFVRFLDDNATE